MSRLLTPGLPTSFPYHTVHTRPAHASSAHNPPNTQGLGLHSLVAPFTLSCVPREEACLVPGHRLRACGAGILWVLGPCGLGKQVPSEPWIPYARLSL